MIDCHLHVWTTDTSTPEKRAERAEQIRREMEALGVDRIALIGEVGETVEACREHNETVAAFVEEYPDLFYGWAAVDPNLGEAGVAEFRRAVEEGGLIGLKHHSNWTHQPISDDALDPYLEAAVDMDVPVIAHVTHRTDEHRDEQPHETQEEHVVEAARKFPDLKLISAHIAAGGDWEYRIKYLADHDPKNVYLDVSGTNCEAGMIEMAADSLGIDRLLFGTDTWLVPGTGKLAGCDLAPAEKAEIAYNFEHLLPDGVGYDGEELAAKREASREYFEQFEEPREGTIVDANAFVGRWPFNPVDGSAEALLARMDRKGVDKALVSSTNGVFYRNVQNANAQLAAELERLDHDHRLIPVATIDPTYVAWRSDLQRCLDEYGMRAVKLLPLYHGYDLDEPAVGELLDYCTARDVPVIFCAVLEDLRKRHEAVKIHRNDDTFRDQWPDAHVDQLIALLKAHPEPDVVIANGWTDAFRINEETTTSRLTGVRLDNAVRSGRTLFVLDDLPMFLIAQGEEIAERIGPDNLVCGAQLPFTVFESYYNYLTHLPVSESEKDVIRSENVLNLVE